MSANLIFLVHFSATLFLVGLIWTIQWVHYPLFDHVGPDGFAAYEAEHSRRITPLVGPLMLLELATAVMLTFGYAPPWFSREIAVAGLLALVAIWLSTALLQVPCHNRLLQAFDRDVIRLLVLTNWIRTLLWTARGVLLAGTLWRALQTLSAGSLES